MNPPATETPAAVVAVASTELTFEQRWAAWEAKGRAQDRAVRRRMTRLVPVVIVAAGILYFLLGR